MVAVPDIYSVRRPNVKRSLQGTLVMPLLRLPRLSAGLQQGGNLLRQGAATGGQRLWTGTSNLTGLAQRGLTGVGQLAQQAKPLLSQAAATVSNSIKPTADAAKQVVKFTANRQPAQPIGAGGLINLAIAPRYFGLDRPVGASTNPLRTVTARPFDRTRQLAGTGLRAGNRLATLATIPAVYQAVTQHIPRKVLHNLYGDVPLAPEEKQTVIQNTTGMNAWPLLARGAAAASGLSRDPWDQAIGQNLRTAVPAYLGYELQKAHQQSPVMAYGVDALRSATPVGLATTLGLHSLHQPTPPQVNIPPLQQLVQLARTSADNAWSGQLLDSYVPKDVVRQTPEDISVQASNLVHTVGSAVPDQLRPVARDAFRSLLNPVNPTNIAATQGVIDHVVTSPQARNILDLLAYKNRLKAQRGVLNAATQVHSMGSLLTPPVPTPNRRFP